MKDISLPEHVRRLKAGEKFRFSCHPEVVCFTGCCRQLDLALSPYDVLRLRKALDLSATAFLDRYALVEKHDADVFPQVFLAMVDDGQGSCPFVSSQGCSVYGDRPGACRTYPVGRGAWLDDTGRPAEMHVLLSEPHCLGFAAGPQLSVADWVADQELALYNEFNDLVMTVLQHRLVREGFRPDDRQQKRFFEMLYDLDGFRLETAAQNKLDDPDLLRAAVRQLCNELFSD